MYSPRCSAHAVHSVAMLTVSACSGWPALQDLASALKLVWERCGQDFVTHVMTVVGPQAGLPPQITEQLILKICQADAKEVKDTLRSLLQAQQAQRGAAG